MLTAVSFTRPILTMSSWNTRFNIFREQANDYHPYIRLHDFVHETLVSFRHKYFYANNPKVACSTILALLIGAEYDEKVDPEHMDYVHFREFIPFLNIRHVGDVGKFLSRPDIFKFCFVRNPYTRLLSAYLNKIVGNEAQKDGIMIQLGYGNVHQKELSFETFVDAVIEQPIMHMDAHWRLQYYQNFHTNIKYDFIGRFEQFDQDLAIVAERLNIDLDKYYKRMSGHATNAGKKVSAFYTPQIAEKVYKKFKIDFEAFNYSKDLPT